MNCKGNFIFKSIDKRDAGTFTDDNGKQVSYGSSYHVQVDEIVDGKIQNRKFKFPVTEGRLANDFENIQPYTPIEINFEINIYASTVRLTPKNVFVVSPEKK